MIRWTIRVGCTVAFVSLASAVVYADNCDGRFDCFRIPRLELGAMVGLILFVALLLYWSPALLGELFVAGTILGGFKKLGELSQKIDPTEEGNVLKIGAEMGQVGVDMVEASESTLSTALFWAQRAYYWVKGFIAKNRR